MARRFGGTVVLRGLDDRVSRKQYDLGVFNSSGDEGQEFEDALDALAQLVGALDDVTDATIVESSITGLASLTPGAGAGDLSEQALLNVWTLDENDPDALEHLAVHYIPAPTIGIFAGSVGADRNRIDRSNSDLVQYVQQVSQHALISDGETIQTGSGVDGMDSGRRITRRIPSP
jgi:hypothetical protein